MGFGLSRDPEFNGLESVVGGCGGSVLIASQASLSPLCARGHYLCSHPWLVSPGLTTGPCLNLEVSGSELRGPETFPELLSPPVPAGLSLRPQHCPGELLASWKAEGT